MTVKSYSVNLSKLVDKENLQLVHRSSQYESTLLTTMEINRPALQLTGFYDYFDARRLQIMGAVECTYLRTLTPEARYSALEQLMCQEIPGLVICHKMEVFPECIALAEKYDRNLLMCEENTSVFEAAAILFLNRELAPRIATHGTLVEVYGEGVLITGESGIGKSETALELIKRGHRLIADDSVEIRRIGERTLLGNAPENIQYYMELRGIGIINARYLYGIGAVRPESEIDLIIRLEPWEDGKFYDRLGLDDEEESILDVSKPSIVVPVRPGRNIAMIIEVAAMNNRQKKMGYNAAASLAAKLDAAIDEGVNQ